MKTYCKRILYAHDVHHHASYAQEHHRPVCWHVHDQLVQFVFDRDVLVHALQGLNILFIHKKMINLKLIGL